MESNLELFLGLCVAGLIGTLWFFSLRYIRACEHLKRKDEQIKQLISEQDNVEKIAQKVIEVNSEKTTETTKQKLAETVKPLQEEMGKLQKRINEINDIENLQHGELKQQLEQLRQLNQQLSSEATNLSRALKGDNKTQGHWGEMILERVLELAGLQKNREYFSQQSFYEDGKTVIPDTIIKLPSNRQVIIDAKVSLKNYEQMTSSEDDNLKQEALQAHAKSIERHIQNLAGKDYANIGELNSLDAVLMFIPIESAWQLALSVQPSLFDLSLKKKILIVTPSSLFTTLRIIAQNWEMERRNKNAEEIAQVGGRLIDKLISYSEDLEKVGKHIESAHRSQDEALKKLTTGRGNALSIARRLNKMGANNRKELPLETHLDETKVDAKVKAKIEEE